MAVTPALFPPICGAFWPEPRNFPADFRLFFGKKGPPLDKLIEKLLDGFYPAQKTTSQGLEPQYEREV
jgi:hypothetical protein